jgi:hypothetical protein
MILSDFYIIRFSSTASKFEDYAKTLDTNRYISIYEHSEIKDFWKKQEVILLFSFFYNLLNERECKFASL